MSYPNNFLAVSTFVMALVCAVCVLWRLARKIFLSVKTARRERLAAIEIRKTIELFITTTMTCTSTADSTIARMAWKYLLALQGLVDQLASSKWTELKYHTEWFGDANNLVLAVVDADEHILEAMHEHYDAFLSEFTHLVK